MRRRSRGAPRQDQAAPVLPVTVRGLEPEARARVPELARGDGAASSEGAVRAALVRVPADGAADVAAWLLRVAAARPLDEIAFEVRGSSATGR